MLKIKNHGKSKSEKFCFRNENKRGNKRKNGATCLQSNLQV